MRPVARAVALFVLVPLLTAPAVNAEVVADAISRADLDAWVERLQLSPEQARAVDGMYDAYLRRQAEMRAGPLAAFRREHPRYASFSSEVDTDVETLRGAAREIERLNGALRADDERFLAEVATVLSEDQLGAVPALRAERRRARLLGGAAQRKSHPALRSDLVPLYLEIAEGLPEETRATTDAHVEAYGRALEREAQAMYDFALRFPVVTAERYLAASAAGGAREAVGAEATDALRDFALRAAALRDAQTELAARAAAVASVHRSLYETISPMLDDDRRERFRARFLAALYPSLAHSRGPAVEEMRRIEERTDAPGELLQAVAAERRLFRAATDEITTAMMDTADARLRSNSSHSVQMSWGESDDYVYEDAVQFDRRLKALAARRDRINRETIDRLQALVDALLPGRLALQRPPPPKVDDDLLTGGLHSSISTGGGGVVYGYRHIPLDQLRAQFGSGRPSLVPISRRDVERWIRRARLDEEHAVLVGILHADYLEAFDAMHAGGPIAAADAARAALLNRESGGPPRLPAADEVQTIFRLERAALEALRGLDAVFFDDVALACGRALPESVVRSMQRERARQRLAVVASPARHALFAFGPPRSAAPRERAMLDVALLAADLELDDADRATIEPMLTEYEQAATAHFEHAFDAVRRYDEQRALLMARNLRWDDEDGLVAEGMEVPPEMGEAGAAMNVALEELVALNQRQRAAIEEVLDGDARAAFSAAYKRAAWPDVYDDRGAVHELIAAALALDDLNADQRVHLAEIRFDYERAYERHCDRIIEAGDDGPARHMHLEARVGLNDRTRHRLRAALTEHQGERLEGLREPE